MQRLYLSDEGYIEIFGDPRDSNSLNALFKIASIEKQPTVGARGKGGDDSHWFIIFDDGPYRSLICKDLEFEDEKKRKKLLKDLNIVSTDHERNKCLYYLVPRNNITSEVLVSESIDIRVRKGVLEVSVPQGRGKKSIYVPCILLSTTPQNRLVAIPPRKKNTSDNVSSKNPQKNPLIYRYDFPDGKSCILMEKNPYPQKPDIVLCTTHPPQRSILVVNEYLLANDRKSFSVGFAKNEMGYHRFAYDSEKNVYSLTETQHDEEKEITLTEKWTGRTLQFDFWMAIEKRKTELQNEIDRWWFTCNHDRKRGKIEYLTALQGLILDSTEQDLSSVIRDIRSVHSLLDKGFFSRRTKKLLNNLEDQCKTTFKKTQ